MVQRMEQFVFFKPNTSFSGGVGFLFTKKFVLCSGKMEEIIKGRPLKVIAKVFVFVFLCIYAPTQPIQRMCFSDTLGTYTDTYQNSKADKDW